MNDARDLLRDLWRSGVRVHLLPDRFRLDPPGIAPNPLKLALCEYQAEVQSALGHLPAPNRCQVCGQVTRGPAGNRGRLYCVTCALTAAAALSACGKLEAEERVDDAVIAVSCGQCDPRPDLDEDAVPWSRLLAAAWAVDGHDPAGLYGALLGLRALGARLASRGDQLHLVHGEIEPEGYASMRARYLVAHTDRLVPLLRSVAAEPER